jgi:arabinofuranan 3-O-arabinosyltransferase
VDGDVRRTEVRGTIGDLLRGTPLSWHVCDGPVEIGEGPHEVRVHATVQYTADRLVLAPLAAPAQEYATRTVRHGSWSAAHQTYEVGPGEEAVLRVAQNVNSGWVATASGRTLEPVTVDGWQQGFVVPSGDAVLVELSFAPDRWYRVALMVGLFSAVLLVVGALLVWWRGPTRRAADSLPPALRPAVRARRRRDGRMSAVAPALVLGGVTLCTWMVGGPVVAFAVLATSVVAAYRPRMLRWAPLAGAVLVAASGLVALGFATGRPGDPPVAADVLAAVGIGVLVTAVTPRRWPRAGRWKSGLARRG